MANIADQLRAITIAVRGEEVRGSIHDAIELINDVSEVAISAGTAVTSPTSSSTGFFEDSLYYNTNTCDLWQCTGTNTWNKLGNLKGTSITGIAKTSTSGLVDTYTISLSDGTSTPFTVTNGKGISNISKSATTGLEDTYTITYTDGTSGTFKVKNGNGIDNIAKTSTSGLVDTYTITYTDGTSKTFDVTNGEDGRAVTGVSLLSKVGLVATYRMTFSDGTHFDYTVSDGASGTGSGDMLKLDYDTNGDLRVNAADTASTLDGLTAGVSALNGIGNKYDTTDTNESNIADADYFPFYDTSASGRRKTLWSNIKAKLKAYFDTLYHPKTTVDTAPTSGSSHLITSDGVFDGDKYLGTFSWIDLFTSTTYLSADYVDKIFRLDDDYVVTAAQISSGLFDADIDAGTGFKKGAFLSVKNIGSASSPNYRYTYYGGGRYFEESGNSQTYTFTHAAIKASSDIQACSDVAGGGDSYTSITVDGTTHTCTVVCPTQVSRTIRIYVE